MATVITFAMIISFSCLILGLSLTKSTVNRETSPLSNVSMLLMTKATARIIVRKTIQAGVTWLIKVNNDTEAFYATFSDTAKIPKAPTINIMGMMMSPASRNALINVALFLAA